MLAARKFLDESFEIDDTVYVYDEKKNVEPFESPATHYRRDDHDDYYSPRAW